LLIVKIDHRFARKNLNVFFAIIAHGCTYKFCIARELSLERSSEMDATVLAV